MQTQNNTAGNSLPSIEGLYLNPDLLRAICHTTDAAQSVMHLRDTVEQIDEGFACGQEDVFESLLEDAYRLRDRLIDFMASFAKQKID